MREFKYPPNGRCSNCHTKHARPGGCIGCWPETGYFKYAQWED